MNDALPAEAARLARVETSARRIFGRFGFGELRTPIVEEAALFQRGIGDATDVVEKEMYVFPDRHGVALALRPEGTASAVRAFLQHNPAADDPLTRWFYLGPMFRHERPQKGRYRQFHQVGAELLGAAAAEADAELLAMVDAWLRDLGLNGITLQLNSIGDAVCRPAYLQQLQAYLRGHGGQLCADCNRRLEVNPLRVLDCKVPSCQSVLAQAPMPVNALCGPCQAHFGQVRQGLEALGIGYQLNPRLVRGLDYYTRTTFEFVWERPSTAAGAASGEALGLGAQNTVAAGGRYDGLVEALGGPPTPAVGFAAGVERLVLALNTGAERTEGPALFVVSAASGDSSAERLAALQLAGAAREAGLWAEIDLRGGSVKSQMRRADRLQARLVVVLGEQELRSGQLRLKQMGEVGSLGAGQSLETNLRDVIAEAQRILQPTLVLKLGAAVP